MPFDKYEVDDLGDLSGEFPNPVQEPEQQGPGGADIFNAPVEPVEPKPAPLNREKYEVAPEKVFYEQPAEEEHVPGQHSADRDGTGKKKSSLLFNLLFFGGILIAVVIFGWTRSAPCLPDSNRKRKIRSHPWRGAVQTAPSGKEKWRSV